MEVFAYGNPAAETVLLQPVGEHELAQIENEIAEISGNAAADFRLIAFRVGDWNSALSPWQAPAVFGKEDFGGGAADTLAEILKYCGNGAASYYVGGYSLAGLFALWAAYQTDVFRGVAAASPSVWFPGFADYMRARRIKSRNVYLSLGSKEEKARDRVLASVGDAIRTAHALLSAQGINCVLEWNEGNHFRDADLRTAKAFSWVMRQE